MTARQSGDRREGTKAMEGPFRGSPFFVYQKQRQRTGTEVCVLSFSGSSRVPHSILEQTLSALKHAIRMLFVYLVSIVG